MKFYSLLLCGVQQQSEIQCVEASSKCLFISFDCSTSEVESGRDKYTKYKNLRGKERVYYALRTEILLYFKFQEALSWNES